MKFIKKLLKKQYLVLMLAGFLFTFVGLVTVSAHGHHNPDQCNSHNEENCPEPTQICNNGEHTGNPHCNQDTPTPTPILNECDGDLCITPTVSPCVSEEVLKYSDEQEIPCPTEEVTPTATPSASPTVTEEPPHESQGGDGLSSCPSCTQAPRDQNGEVLSSEVGWK